jgi:hypothetical protein
VLAIASLLAGALLAWVTAPEPTAMPEPPLPAASAQVSDAVERIAPRKSKRPRGVIALGDLAMLSAQPCLEAHGIDVYPRAIGSPADLTAAVRRLVDRHAAWVIHVGERTGIVDGQVRQVLDLLGPRNRVVWATIRVPGSGGGEFTFEDRTNASIRNVVGRSPTGRVLEWSAMSRQNPAWTVDGIRLTPTGCEEYALRTARLVGKARTG